MYIYVGFFDKTSVMEVSLKGVKDTLIPCDMQNVEILQRMAALAKDKSVLISLNNVINTDNNELCGWCCTIPGKTPANVIQMNSNLYECISVVETLADENTILDLLKNKKKILNDLNDIANKMLPENNTKRPSWFDCGPDSSLPLQNKKTWNYSLNTKNFSKYFEVHDKKITLKRDAPIELIPDDTIPNFIDSNAWDPELGNDGFIGLYHQWYSNIPSGKRELKLFIVCQSSCQKAGLEIKQLANDLPDDVTLTQFANSEVSIRKKIEKCKL